MPAGRPSKHKPDLGELLIYDPDTGKLFWKPRPAAMFKQERDATAWNNRNAGKEAFTAISGGYKAGCLFGKTYRAHRIIGRMLFGGALKEIDHINGDRSDNRRDNLRNVTRTMNNRNVRLGRNNKSGVKGVSWHKQAGKWVARIRENGQYKHLGLFSDIADAALVRKTAEQQLGYHANHGQ